MIAASAMLAAQDPKGSIRGSVHDRDFDLPLAGALVQILESGQKVATTSEGKFVFPQVAPGKYTLVFAKEGYARVVRGDVVVGAGKLSDLHVALAGDFTDLDEFVVQDLLKPGGASEAGLLQLRLESPALLDSVGAELMSRAGASDAASALRLVAGASVADGKSAVIRGLPDRYVSSQINGLRLPTADEDKRAVELDQFPAAVIESIQVSKTFTPDQQGDASGGAVNLRLKGIPNEPLFLEVKAQAGYNSQVGGRSNFLSYESGGVSAWGRDDGGRRIQYDKIGSNWDGAVGVTETDAPTDSKWSIAGGGVHEYGDGVKLGGSFHFYHERDSSYFDNGVSDSYWVEKPGAKMMPKTFQGTVPDGDFKTGLFDVTQGKESVKWGGLGTVGLATEDHQVNLLYLYSHTAEDSATLAEDTRGKQYFFPGHDPDDPSTPGHLNPDAAPYLRLETLNYTERGTDTLQLNGTHQLSRDLLGEGNTPELDWVLARSRANLDQPDKRQFGTLWVPGRQIGTIVIPPIHKPYKPGANFTLGNLQRIFKEIEEESDQYAANLKLPFAQWSDDKASLKVGVFHDELDRTFDQETFSNFNDNGTYSGKWRDFWSRKFPTENHPITESLYDVDYKGEQRLSAWYAMLDLPLVTDVNLVGGARFESTSIGIVNDPEANATWFPPGSLVPTKLNPGDADVAFEQHDVLPALGLVVKPSASLTLRASYAETVARQTFKELTPILQQEFLGGPIFIGNPDLGMSAIKNYDLRLDYAPREGTLLSASWFRKDIKDPIEYVQRLATFEFTTAVNYPKGRLSGYELEVRERLGQHWEALEGLAVGANATFIDSEVTLPKDEADGFNQGNIRAPMTTRDMTNAPEHLYNLYLTYDLAQTDTHFGVFYTVQGDALVAGATQSNGNYVPNVYATEFDTLNVSVTQGIGKHVKLFFQAKNLTNPEIAEVYRSPYIGEDVTKSSYTNGIDYALGLTGVLRF